MKLENEKKYIEKSDNFKETEFTIQNSPHAFKILSSGIYSNEIKSIIRELACNAWDSHIAANTTDIPFEVTLPTTLSKVFAVKDYGTGLSKEDVENLYTSYFKSTKSSSNDFTGAFGLGSKSPFSYTNSFTVTSIYNNKKYIFSAFISESGFPSISLLSESDTEERNGLKVEFSVKDNDIWKFEYESLSALKYFPLAPKCNSIDFDNFEYPEKGYLVEYGKNYINAVQGNVEYPVEMDGLPYVGIGTTLFFDIGELNVTASREKLQYDSKTLDSLNRKLKLVYDKIKKEISDEILNNDSYLKCYFKYRDLIDKGVQVNFLSSLNLEYNGVELTSAYTLPDNIKRAYYYKNGKWKIPTTSLKSKDFIIFVADTKKYVKPTIEKWLEENSYNSDALLIYLKDDEEFNDEHILTSSLPEYTPPKTKTVKTENIIDFHDYYYVDYLKREIDNSSDQTVYYLECNYKVIEGYDYHSLKKWKEYFNLQEVDVVALTSSKLKTLKNKDNYVDFGEYIVNLIKEELDKSSELLYTCFSSKNPNVYFMSRYDSSYIEQIEDENLKETLEVLSKLDKEEYFTLIGESIDYFNEKVEKLNLMTDEKMVGKYPLMKYTDRYLANKDAVIEYFNLKYLGDKK